MTRGAFAVALLAALLASPAAAQTVYIDWDDTVDFSALETFAWKDTGLPSLEAAQPLLHEHIVGAVITQLESSGLRQTEDAPDFFITYHGETTTEVRIDTMDYGYAYGRGWRWGYMGPSTSRAYSYDRGNTDHRRVGR